MFKKKSKEYTVPYDPYTQYPVIRASICNGERIAGFKSREDGHFYWKDYYTIVETVEEYRKSKKNE